MVFCIPLLCLSPAIQALCFLYMTDMYPGTDECYKSGANCASETIPGFINFYLLLNLYDCQYHAKVILRDLQQSDKTRHIKNNQDFLKI